MSHNIVRAQITSHGHVRYNGALVTMLWLSLSARIVTGHDLWPYLIICATPPLCCMVPGDALCRFTNSLNCSFPTDWQVLKHIPNTASTSPTWLCFYATFQHIALVTWDRVDWLPFCLVSSLGQCLHGHLFPSLHLWPTEELLWQLKAVQPVIVCVSQSHL